MSFDHRDNEDRALYTLFRPWLSPASDVDRGGELDLEVSGDGSGDIEAGVIGDSGEDTEAGDRGELQGVSPDSRHLTCTGGDRINFHGRIILFYLILRA